MKLLPHHQAIELARINAARELQRIMTRRRSRSSGCRDSHDGITPPPGSTTERRSVGSVPGAGTLSRRGGRVADGGDEPASRVGCWTVGTCSRRAGASGGHPPRRFESSPLLDVAPTHRRPSPPVEGGERRDFHRPPVESRAAIPVGGVEVES